MQPNRGNKHWVHRIRDFSEGGRSLCYPVRFLCFSYPEHPGAAGGTYALSGRFAVLHDDRLWILDLDLGPALHAVRFHASPPYLHGPWKAS